VLLQWCVSRAYLRHFSIGFGEKLCEVILAAAGEIYIRDWKPISNAISEDTEDILE
jgi:hypothetical protein